MDASAAELISTAEKHASEELERERTDLEKKLVLEEKNLEEAFESFKHATAQKIARAREKKIEGARLEAAAIRKKWDKTLAQIETTSKKNVNDAIRAFVKIASTWGNE